MHAFGPGAIRSFRFDGKRESYNTGREWFVPMIAEIKFACPHCGQRIAVGSDAAGVSIECPTCQNGVTIPNGSDPAEPEQNDGELRERLEASRAENERLRSNATLAQAEIKGFNNERLALRNEAANHRQRAAVAESRLAAMQGELDLSRQRLNATETQLGSAERELAESRAAGARQAGEQSAVEQEIAGIRSNLAAALAALEQMQIAAAMEIGRASCRERVYVTV